MKILIEELGFFFKERKLRYLIILLCMIIQGLSYMIPARIVGIVIDHMVQSTLTFSILMYYIAVFLGAGLAAYIFGGIWSSLLFAGYYEVGSIFRKNIVAHVLSQRAAFFQKFRTGDLVTRSSEDVSVLGETVGFGFYALMNSVMMLSAVLVTMAVTISWQLMLVAILPSPILAYLMHKWGFAIETAFETAQKKVSDLNNDVLEMIDGTYVVRAYGQEDAFVEEFKRRSKEACDESIRVADYHSRFMPTSGFFMSLSFTLGFLYGAYLVQQGVIELGDVIAFQVYVGMTIWPVITVGEVVTVFQRGTTSAKRIREVLHTKDGMEHTGNQMLEDIHTWTLKQLNFTYPQESQLALKNIDLTVQNGQTIGIVGKTGSGKTSLLRQFLLQYPFKASGMEINGQMITAYDPETILNHVTYVPQEHTLFSRSIRENLYFGNDKASDDELLEALRLAAFDKEVQAMPEGLETLVGEKGISLSGGQKQRLSIARAFLRHRSILLLDDALSAVDAKTEQEIIKHIQQVRKEQTTLITSHRLSAVCQADEIIVLDQGEIIARGTHEGLLEQCDWYMEQFKRQEMEGDA